MSRHDPALLRCCSARASCHRACPPCAPRPCRVRWLGTLSHPGLQVMTENRFVTSRSCAWWRAGFDCSQAGAYCARDRARRPPLAIATKNFLLRPTVKNCHNGGPEFSVTTENQKWVVAHSLFFLYTSNFFHVFLQILLPL